jgi:hypothetical protein
MIYLKSAMRKFIRPALVIGISLALALCSAALTHTAQPIGQGKLYSAAFFLQQTTPTPVPVDVSEVGSTDGIVIAGFVIVAIVIVPILIRRKAWMNTQ